MGDQKELQRKKKSDEKLLIAVIAEEDIVLGFLLAGTGQTDTETKMNNYAIIYPETTDDELTHIFLEIFKRKDIGLIFLEEDLAKRLGSVIKNTNKVLPIILEIPGKPRVQ